MCLCVNCILLSLVFYGNFSGNLKHSGAAAVCKQPCATSSHNDMLGRTPYNDLATFLELFEGQGLKLLVSDCRVEIWLLAREGLKASKEFRCLSPLPACTNCEWGVQAHFETGMFHLNPTVKTQESLTHLRFCMNHSSMTPDWKEADLGQWLIQWDPSISLNRCLEGIQNKQTNCTPIVL